MAPSEHLTLIGSYITRAAQLAGLMNTNQICGGVSDGDGLIWTWRWFEAPGTIIAGVDIGVRPDEFGEGAGISVYAGAYDYEDREKSFSRIYWGRFVRYEDLTPQGEDMVNGLKEGLGRAWQELPRLVSLMPQLAEQKRALRDELRRRNLLGE